MNNQQTSSHTQQYKAVPAAAAMASDASATLGSNAAATVTSDACHAMRSWPQKKPLCASAPQEILGMTSGAGVAYIVRITRDSPMCTTTITTTTTTTKAKSTRTQDGGKMKQST